ncbi:hypothetical protein GCM10009738_87430 [Kitasatospora viridis]
MKSSSHKGADTAGPGGVMPVTSDSLGRFACLSTKCQGSTAEPAGLSQGACNCTCTIVLCAHGGCKSRFTCSRTFGICRRRMHVHRNVRMDVPMDVLMQNW